MQPLGHNANPAVLCQTATCKRQTGASEPDGGACCCVSQQQMHHRKRDKDPAESQMTLFWLRFKLQDGAAEFMK